ncbi:hypothetical protein Tco_0615722 [Tanacetum coccineum]
MSTHEQITNNPTSAVRNTRGRNGPQGLEEPMSDENLEEGTETGIPEAHHRTPVYSKDSRRTDPLHRSPGRGKKEACLIGWEERSQLHPHVLIVVGEVPKQKELKLKQEGVNNDETFLVDIANTQKVRTVKGVTGSPNQEDRDRTLMRTISPSLGHARKETPSHLGNTGILFSLRGDIGCPSHVIHMTEAETRKIT